jgi:hypothetical protein
LDLALASREKNELHLVACFGWKNQGDELRQQRETVITTGSLAMYWGTRGRGCGLRVCGHVVGSMVKKKRTSVHSRAQLRALAQQLLGRQQQKARQWLRWCKKREHVRETLGSYTKCRRGCVHAKVQLWTKQIEHLRSSARASNFHGSTASQHRQASMEKRAAWLAPACVCQRETLDAELQTGQKRRQLDLAQARQRIAQLKVEP